MKPLPNKVISKITNAEFKPISMNLGGIVKLKQLTKGTSKTRIGSIKEIDFNEIGTNFI